MKLVYSFLLFLSSISLLQGQSVTKLSPEIDAMLQENRIGEALALSQNNVASIKHPSSNEELNLFYQHAVVLYYAQAFDKALEVTQEVVAVLESKDKTSKDYVEVLGFQAGIYQSMGLYSEALEGFEQAIAVVKKHQDTENENYLTLLNNLSMLKGDLGQYDEAIRLMKEFRSLVIDSKGKEGEYYATALNNLAVLHENKGRYDEATPYYEEAAELMATSFGINHPKFGLSLINLGSIYRYNGFYDRAEQIYQQADSILQQTIGQQHPLYADLMNNMGLLYKRMGRATEAERFYLLAKDIRAQTLGKQHPDYAASLNNLSIFYINKKDYKGAEKVLMELESLLKQVLGKGHPLYSTCLYNLGTLYIEMDDYSSAERYFLEAKALRGQTIGVKSFPYAEVTSNLAALYSELGDTLKAMNYFEETQAIVKEITGGKHPLLALSYNHLANYYLLNGKHYEAAIAAIEQSIEANSLNNEQTVQLSDDIKKVLLDNEFSNIDILFKALRNLNQIYKETNQKNKQLELTQASVQLIQQILKNYNTHEDRLQLITENSYFVASGIEQSYQLYQGGATGNAFEQALNFLTSNRFVILTQSLKSNKATKFGDLPDSLSAREKDLQFEVLRLKKEMLETKNEEQRKAIRADFVKVTQQMGQFQQRLKKEYTKYYKSSYELRELEVAAIQAQLASGEAIISYFLADSVSYIFYLSNRGSKFERIAVSKSALEQQVEILRKSLVNYDLIKTNADESKKLFVKAASALYQDLLSPVLTGEEQHLIIIPDGALAHIPFEVLLKDEKEEDFAQLNYLIKQCKVSYNYSILLWEEMKKTEVAVQANALLAAAASYGSQNDSLSSRAARAAHLRNLRAVLNDLPAARAEVKALEKQMTGSFWYGPEANEAAFKAQASEYNIIHLAMHGLLNEQHPILSSLAFTENGDSTEDNFLQAYEISRLDLNAQLVVLSACETGYGKFQQGEGVMSLARSFMYAGVPSLVVSLWQVNDASTSVIMQEFYANLGKGMDKAEALRAAKLQYLERAEGASAHPAFWASFIQLGDSRPVDLPAKGGSSILLWVWVLGIPVVVAVVFWRVLRKRRDVSS